MIYLLIAAATADGAGQRVIETVIKADNTVIYWLLGLCMTGLIGVYTFNFAFYGKTLTELGKIYALVNVHVQDITLHPRKNEVVNADVCAVIQTGVKTELGYVKAQVMSVDSKVELLDRKMDTVLVNITKVLDNNDKSNKDSK